MKGNGCECSSPSFPAIDYRSEEDSTGRPKMSSQIVDVERANAQICVRVDGGDSNAREVRDEIDLKI